MNRKETLIWSIIDNVIKACDIKSIGMIVDNINNYYSL